MSIPQLAETTDEIILEVRRAKERLAESCGFDVDAIINHVKSHHLNNDGQLVEPPSDSRQVTNQTSAKP